MILKGKTVLITGAGSGIGRATASLAAAQGAFVIVSDVNTDGVAQTAREITDQGGRAVSEVVDLTDDAATAELIATAVRHLGQLDAAINCAGITSASMAVHELPEADAQQVIAVNFFGILHAMRHQIAAMLETRTKGSIVNIASAAGLVGTKGLGIYGASKHAVVGLSRSAALDYADRAIRVNAVCPGTIETPMIDEFIRLSGDPGVMDAIKASHPMGRAGRPIEVAEAAIWLASDLSSFTTGAALSVDGGLVAQ